MAQTVIGIFDSASEAQTAVQHLVNNGFTRSNIDVSASSSSESVSSSSDRYDRDKDDDSIGNFFKNLFGGNDDDESRSYSEVARRGSMVTVHVQSAQEAQQAASILDQYGAVDVNERSNQYRSGASTGAAATTDNSASIQVIEEELQVGKRVVETGGARIRSRIVERPVEESLRLREEHVHIERHAVNRPVSEADLAAFKEGTIEMTEHAEVPVVSKQARVVEEISISKDVEEREEVIRDTVRRTDVDVENLSSTDRKYTTDDERRLSSDRDDDLSRPANL